MREGGKGEEKERRMYAWLIVFLIYKVTSALYLEQATLCPAFSQSLPYSQEALVLRKMKLSLQLKILTDPQVSGMEMVICNPGLKYY